jgi:adenine C2-methylase RlmN of 23S rRNA A2503 and tRNA A37
MLEYIVLDEINDSEENAHQLGQLLKSRDVVCGVAVFVGINGIDVF